MKESRFSARKLATLGMLAAISIALVLFVHFPIFPSASFLEYDPADIPILIGTFLFGPWSGLLLTLVVCLIQGFTVSFAMGGMSGILMHLIATGAMVLVTGSIYQHGKSLKRAVIALVAGAITMTLVMIPCNLIITPAFTGAPLSAVVGMMAPIIVPFNMIKAGVNCVITFFVYKPISKLYKQEKRAATSEVR